MYKSKYFKIEELVTPELFALLPEELLWRLFEESTLRWLDAVREAWGKPLLINNWHGTKFWQKFWGSKIYRESGLRNFNTKTGARLSKHRFAKGFDLKTEDPKDIPALWNMLVGNRDLGTARVEHIEATPTWVHGEPGGVVGQLPRVFRP